MDINEIWKDVVGYEGRYQVSNLGRVRSLDRLEPFMDKLRRHHGRVMIPQYFHGYMQVHLRKCGQRTKFWIHRLVAVTFMPESINECVHHKDRDRQNNCLENLEWCTVDVNNQQRKNSKDVVF